MSPKDLLLVVVVALGSFMSGLDATIVNIALPSIAKTLSISTVTSSWVLNAYLIVLVSLLLAASRLGDIKGYKRLFIGGFLIFTIGSALCGLSTTIEMLIASRMLQAIGGSAIAALGAVMVTSYLPSSVRGQALGIVAMFTMLGAALGPVIGGFLTSVYSWPFIFFVNVPVGIIAVILGMRIIPSKPPVAPDERLDIPGVVLVFIAIATLIFGLTTVQGAAAVAGGASIVVSVVFWLLFVARERTAKEPLINLKLFSNRSFSFQNINVLLVQMGMAGVMVLMPFYLEMVKDISTGNAGAILLALPIGMILTAPIAGKFSDVIGTKKPIIAGFVISALAMYLLSTLSAHSSIGHVSIYLFLLGAGSGIAYSPLNSAVMGESPAPDRGMTSGLLKMMTNLGSSIGIAMVMLVALSAIGPELAKTSVHSVPVKDLVLGFDMAFLFLMVMEIVGIVLMLGVREHEPVPGSGSEPVVGF
jgi:DHA2 family metal-tetracycline-proton antiporter-like MFS transporter